MAPPTRVAALAPGPVAIPASHPVGPLWTVVVFPGETFVRRRKETLILLRVDPLDLDSALLPVALAPDPLGLEEHVARGRPLPGLDRSPGDQATDRLLGEPARAHGRVHERVLQFNVTRLSRQLAPKTLNVGVAGVPSHWERPHGPQFQPPQPSPKQGRQPIPPATL